VKKIILVTGISSGFGRETAKVLAEKGHSVYGTVRIDCDAPDRVSLLKMDLTDHGSVDRAVKTIIEKEGRIDILINNSGMHTGGPVETTPEENIRLQMNTNFTGMVHLTKAVLPEMRRNGGGMIINISSIGGLMGLPFQAFYSASKFAVEGFSEALRMEVKRFNIKVIVINPGDFHTSNSANRRKFLAPAGTYQGQFERSLKVIEKDEADGWGPEILAQKISMILESNNPRQRYVVASFEQKLAVVLKKLLPGKWFTWILTSHYKID
jgi:NAD(P)-dependent dehydrogenase (short-subunit alcohol dehydrogenase family)